MPSISDIRTFAASVVAPFDVSLTSLGMVIEEGGGGIRVRLDASQVSFDRENADWDIERERLSGLLRRSALRDRLRRLARSQGEERPGGWSVFSTALAADWLTWNAGGAGTRAWHQAVGRIADAAWLDADVLVPLRPFRKPGLSGAMRRRRLLARIRLGAAVYDSRDGSLRTPSRIPETAACSVEGRTLQEYVELPHRPSRGHGLVTVDVSARGTVFHLEEDWVPLVPHLPDGCDQDAWPESARVAWLLSGMGD